VVNVEVYKKGINIFRNIMKKLILYMSNLYECIVNKISIKIFQDVRKQFLA